MSRPIDGDFDEPRNPTDQEDPDAFEGMTLKEALEAVGYGSQPRPRIIVPQGRPREPLKYRRIRG